VLAAASWELQNHFRIASSGSGGGAATALSWRQPAPGLPPLLLVGTAQAGAQIWAYQQQFMRWEQAASLGSPQVCAHAAAYDGTPPPCCAVPNRSPLPLACTTAHTTLHDTHNTHTHVTLRGMLPAVPRRTTMGGRCQTWRGPPHWGAPMT
jgi:hypothetical protein